MRKFAPIYLFIYLSIHLIIFLSPPPIFAQPKEWDSIIKIDDIPKCFVMVNGDKIPTIQGFECVVYNISTVIVPFAGLAVFFILIAGAFKLMTSGGEPKQIQAAWKTITFAVVGIVIVLAIWFIIRLVVDVTGVEVRTFEVPMWVPQPTPTP